jgi:hypothetical protein
VNASYGFSQKRQTNFATIGEGTIIVRDGNTDLSGLNRDITKAQYGTVDIGLKGGFTVDSSTVAFVTNPEKQITIAIDSVEKVYDKSIILYERTTNFINEKGFLTNTEIRIQDALASGNFVKYGSLDYFSNKIELGYYGNDGERIQLVRDDQGKVTALVERTGDGTTYGVYKYDSGSTVYAALDYSLNNPDFNLTGSLTKEDYRNNTDYIFGVLRDVSDSAGIIKSDELFSFTVEGAKSYFSKLTFADQGQLNYTYAGIMDNLGIEFDGKISYGTNAVTINGTMSPTSKIDCSSYAVTGIYVLGMANSDKTGTAVNPQYQNTSDFTYTPTNKWITSTANGPAVLTYNESVVTRYDANLMNGVDKTGLIGITIVDQGKIFRDYKLDHVYVSLDKDAKSITESYGPTHGVSIDYKNIYSGDRTKYYLQLNLPEDRKSK